MPETEQQLGLPSRNTYCFAQLRYWYNGYSSGDGVTYVYNPFSILSFFRKADFRNFWFETGTPTFLLKLLHEQWLYKLNDLTVSERTLTSYDIEELQAIPILFSTGYLTIKAKDRFGQYTLDYPNAEVKESMLEYMISDLRHEQELLATPNGDSTLSSLSHQRPGRGHQTHQRRLREHSFPYLSEQGRSLLS